MAARNSVRRPRGETRSAADRRTPGRPSPRLSAKPGPPLSRAPSDLSLQEAARRNDAAAAGVFAEEKGRERHPEPSRAPSPAVQEQSTNCPAEPLSKQVLACRTLSDPRSTADRTVRSTNAGRRQAGCVSGIYRKREWC